jgi:PPP family 3-phenylpropionic acid transporter
VRTAAALRVYYACSFAALGVYLPYFPRWLEARGIAGWAMGAVAASFPAMGVLGPPLFGLLADRLGLRGSLLRLASGGAFVAFAALAAIALGGEPSLGLVLAAVVAFAFFRAPMVMMADVLALERAEGSRGYGGQRLWGSLGFLASAVACGRWLDVGAALPLPLAIAATLLVALLVSFALPARAAAPRAPIPEHVRALVAAGDMRRFLAASFLGQAAHAAYDLLFTLHLRDLGVPAGDIGVAWAVGVLAEVALMAASARVLALAPPARLLTLAFAGAALRWLLVALAPSAALLFALQPLHAVSFCLMWLASVAYLRARAPAHVLASAQGIFVATIGAASAAGMLVWGAAYRVWGAGTIFVLAAVVAGLASLVAARMPTRPSASSAAP